MFGRAFRSQVSPNTAEHIPRLCSREKLIYLLVREPAILLIKWLRPKGLKVCSYVEKYAEFKNQTLKKIGWYTKVLCATEYPGVGNFSN